MHLVALNQISTADGHARVSKFNDINTFPMCPAFPESMIPTAFPFLRIFPLFRTYTPVNPIQIESYLDEVSERSHHYAWIS
jgi:hypothetical protein